MNCLVAVPLKAESVTIITTTFILRIMAMRKGATPIAASIHIPDCSAVL